MQCTFSRGGLHGVNNRYTNIIIEDECLIESDIESFYLNICIGIPNILLNSALTEHCTELLQKRLTGKQNHNNICNQSLKLILNSISGLID